MPLRILINVDWTVFFKIVVKIKALYRLPNGESDGFIFVFV
jgi:hypothetical protein